MNLGNVSRPSKQQHISNNSEGLNVLLPVFSAETIHLLIDGRVKYDFCGRLEKAGLDH
jgi:hypothetical protein